MRVATRAVLAGFVLVLLLATPAFAHATLETSDPPDGSHVAIPPDRVLLVFSEKVQGGSDAVRVVDADGKRADLGDAAFNGSSVDVGIDPDSGRGGYIVAYRVLSADSHPVSGAFSYVVGDGTAPSAAAVSDVFDDSAERPYEIVGAIMRWFAFGGALAALGLGVLYAMALPTGVVSRRLGRAAVVAATIGLVATLLELLPRAALATGRGFGSLNEAGELSRLLGDGVGLGIALLALGLGGVVSSVILRPSETSRALGVGGAVLVALSFVPAGHPRTTSPKVLAMSADFVHVGAGGVWFGGLLGLALVWRAVRADGGFHAAADLVYQFSRMVTVTIVALWIAGTALAWTEVRTLDGLTGTTYGRVLALKVMIVGVVTFLGALNHFRLLPAISGGAVGEVAPEATPDADREWPWRQLGNSVRTEVLLLAGVVVLSAVLVNITPANSVDSGGPQIVRADLGTGSVEMVVEPAKRGENSIHISLFDAQGRLADLAPEGLTLEFSLPSASITGLEGTPDPLGKGHYVLVTDAFSVAGEWNVEVKALVTDFDELTADAAVKISG